MPGQVQIPFFDFFKQAPDWLKNITPAGVQPFLTGPSWWVIEGVIALIALLILYFLLRRLFTRDVKEKDLVTVFTLDNPVKAEIIKNALQADGIRCFLDGANQAAEAGLMALQIQVQVSAENVSRATKIIESHEAAHKAKPHAWTEKKQ